ncbi:MAG: ATP synthase F1 subunit gamma [Candidatus Sumerlaeaceae bacterium]|nr:ATP synthase F1 subunit gamma [Candidatus Sumerlaeaceae bacterium]
MAENVKSLRRRVRSIKNTKQITRAMEMVSAAKLRRAQDLLMAGRPYASKLREFMGHLASSAESTHPFFTKREVKRRTLVVVTSDRGLAGGFNTQVIKKAEAALKASPVPMELVCIGRKGYDYFKNKPYKIVFQVTDMGGKVSGAGAAEIADRVAKMFLDGETDEVLLLFNSFISTMMYAQQLEKLLPLDPEELLGASAAKSTSAHHVDYILEPTPQRVFDSILPRFIRSRVYMAIAETGAAEHSARMIAMSAATKNCTELIDSVSLKMNKARQAMITKEILEVVGGAEALKG